MTYQRFASLARAPRPREARRGLGPSARWLLGALLPLAGIACGDTSATPTSSSSGSNSTSGSGTSSSDTGAGGASSSSASSSNASSSSSSGAGGGMNELVFKNPVLPGDFADPSMIRVGTEYWATATSSEWGPPYPLLHSKDLVNWDPVGTVFTQPPAWASAHFWAPEISEDKGKYYVFFTAQKTGGSLCIGSASAAQPGGPYVDSGAPLVCQDDGSIDAFSIRDEKGKRYLLWKEDGNSIGKPTPIWAQELSDDGAKLLGQKEMLFQNEPSWEANLVEGPFVLKRGDYFYTFYSGAGCCGTGCSYAMGVARAKSLHGPWEKNPQNPILAANSVWKCPGHGSIVTTPDGRYYLLYHAYSVKDSVYVGRQGMLDEVVFGTDDWPSINAGMGPSIVAPAPIAKQAPRITDYKDEFTGTALAPGWQYPVAAPPTTTFDAANGGSLVLHAIPADAQNFVGAVVGRSTQKGDYEVKTKVTPDAGMEAGISAYGDSQNALGLSVSDGKLYLWRVGLGKSQNIAMGTAAASSLYLRMTASSGHVYKFFTSTDGTTWTQFGPLVDSLAGNYDLPPWDRGVRAVLFAKGATALSAKFDFFEMTLPVTP